VYNFTPLTLDEIRQHGITDELAVRWSQGSIGRARALDMTRLKGEREVVMDFLETVVGATEEHFQDLLAVSAELGRAKQEFESRMDLLAVLIADVFYLKEGVGDKLINIDLKDRLQKVAGKISDDRMIQMAEFLRLVELSLKTNVNRQMLMDALAVTGNETAAGWLL